MRLKTIGMAAGILLLTLAHRPLRADDALLIKDMESLRDSLPFKDPGRPTLTRRLADLHFQTAVEKDKTLILTGKGNVAEVTAHRERAARLYREAMDGEGGTYSALDGELKTKTQFQLARLDRMAGKRAQALASFTAVSTAPTAGQDLKREALLTMAEMREEDGLWKESLAAYQEALPLCRGPEAVSYVKYRIAWGYFRMNDYARAQSEIAEALWDGQGRPKEQVIADYVQFLSATPGVDGKDALTRIEPLAQKVNNANLINDLGNAFFAAGNRRAGVLVFSHLQRLRPSPFIAARLAEEYYGFRQWDDVKNTLSYLMGAAGAMTKLEPKQLEATDQILRRLVVQLDGERKSNPGQFQTETLQAIEVHLTLFPRSDVRTKMREGWLAAQVNEQAKMDRLAIWEKDDAASDKTAEHRWRQERAAIALRLKNHAVIREEATALSLNATDESQRREWSYIAGKAALDAGDSKAALMAFRDLAKPSTHPDQWAIQSQHLALDILNKQKRFDELAQQAALWTSDSALKSDKALSAEVATMDKVREEALFESAAGKGESVEALASFLSFCLEGKLKEKSCANAKVLAVKLGKQQELVQVLEAQNDQDALVVEYERMARFSDAAKILEARLDHASSETEWLKVVVLHQVAGDQEGSTRLLKKFALELQHRKKISPELEPALRMMYLTAGFSAGEILRLPWSAATKLHIAATLEDSGKGDAHSHKLVVSSTQDVGATWAELTIARLDAMDAKQRMIAFYGGNSRALFQKRLKALSAFADQTKKILPGARVPLRAHLLGRLSAAYKDLDKEIMATPLPVDLPAEQLAQVQEALESLAGPIRKEGEEYQALIEEQLATLTEDAPVWRQILSEGKDAVLAKLRSPARTTASTLTGLGTADRQSALNALAQNPRDVHALTQLRDDHLARGEEAPAAYFDGRIAESKGKL